MFYTCLPVSKIWPQSWPLEFRWIARWVPWVGLVVGGVLALADGILAAVHMPTLVRSAIVVAVAIGLTGGLHLDGVIDTADGLALPQHARARRLAAMADSRMGAFGGMAAIVLILLKVTAIAALISHRAFVLIAVSIWGRWGQQWAIARYPYLKKEGKGAFHKAALPSVRYTLPSLIAMVMLSLLVGNCGIVPWSVVWRTILGGFSLSLLTSAYFYQQLGGHTGDTYGAVVEWTEALLLCSLTIGQ
ncbi:MAG: adenosylcobinamide-GDP ribazoletransferase [Phormidesmis sp. RL_2_1]|nr:adenosylcobinamide-GDP ribazoletransferase [Phormidesmis sp. RL_2_1]